MQSVGSAIDAVHAQFEQADLYFGHGTDNAWDEAVALVLTVSGASDDQASLALPLSDEHWHAINQLANQRVQTRSPLAYLLGRCQYRGLEFIVRPGMIVPRSPLGFLLPDAISPWQSQPVQRVVDLCSGTGCLGIIAAMVYPDAEVALIELDAAACEVAQANVALHQLTERVSVQQGDVNKLDLPPSDLIICNPPYVNAEDMQDLPAEYQAEPKQGLAAGDDGLAVMGPLLDRASDLLNPGGVFLGEVGLSAAALEARFEALPRVWWDLPHGGDGVFLLEADALSSHTARLS